MRFLLRFIFSLLFFINFSFAFDLIGSSLMYLIDNSKDNNCLHFRSYYKFFGTAIAFNSNIIKNISCSDKSNCNIVFSDDEYVCSIDFSLSDSSFVKEVWFSEDDILDETKMDFLCSYRDYHTAPFDDFNPNCGSMSNDLEYVNYQNEFYNDLISHCVGDLCFSFLSNYLKSETKISNFTFTLSSPFISDRSFGYFNRIDHYHVFFDGDFKDIGHYSEVTPSNLSYYDKIDYTYNVKLVSYLSVYTKFKSVNYSYHNEKIDPLQKIFLLNLKKQIIVLAIL